MVQRTQAPGCPERKIAYFTVPSAGERTTRQAAHGSPTAVRTVYGLPLCGLVGTQLLGRAMEGVGCLPSTGCQSAVQARRIDHRRGVYFFRAKLAAGLGATDIDPVGRVAEVRGLAPVDRNPAGIIYLARYPAVLPVVVEGCKLYRDRITKIRDFYACPLTHCTW